MKVRIRHVGLDVHRPMIASVVADWSRMRPSRSPAVLTFGRRLAIIIGSGFGSVSVQDDNKSFFIPRRFT